jgi:acyl dehydratase
MPEPERQVVEQRGLWFEEFDINARYVHAPGRTVSEADNVIFTTLTMNGQPLHLDAHWSADQPFGQRLVNSFFTLSTVVGLSVGHLMLGTTVANLGFRDIQFPHPVYHGDTLYSETVVVEKRPSKSRPEAGIVTLEHTGRNQDGVIVVVVNHSSMVLLRPVGSK